MFLALCTLGLSAQAGWTSGGGEFLQDTRNPWWVHNTTEVKYCILHDAQNFGVSKEIARKKIVKALNFWKAQLGETTTYHIGDRPTKIAQHNFIETENCEEALLKFQLGVLNDEQFEYLKNPKKYMSIAVRTSYDQVNLRGQGFIYVSPERGPLKPAIAPETMWSEGSGALILPVVLHELGHVFGIHHDSDILIMKEHFPEGLVSPQAFRHNAIAWSYFDSMGYLEQTHLLVYKGNILGNMMCNYQSAEPLPSQPKPSSSVMGYEDIRAKFFGFEHLNQGCLQYVIKDHRFQVFHGDTEKTMKMIGEAVLTKTVKTMKDFNPLIWLDLTEKQKVFKAEARKYVVVLSEGLTVAQGKYKILATGVERDLSLDLSPWQINRVMGMMDGKMIVDVELGL
jgi:hypothetical protein